MKVLQPPHGTDLLLEPHDLEALKVRQLLSPFRLCPLLRPASLRPLRFNLRLLPFLLHLSGTRRSRQSRDDDRGEEHMRERGGVAGNCKLCIFGRAIDENLESSLVG